MVLGVYTFLIYVISPFIPLWLALRARTGKEDRARLSERYGITDKKPFDAAPIWIHAASVGESLAALPLIDMIRDQIPNAPILMTTGTVSGARMMEKRLPAGCIHQYTPLDHPLWVNRFMRHWQPRYAIRMESEIWPHTILALKRAGIRTALLNGWISPRSYNRWQKIPGTARRLFETFHSVLAIGNVAADRFTRLGSPHVTHAHNIKFLSNPLPADPDMLDRLHPLFGPRACWIYASTHADEEGIAATIHENLREKIPGLLTVIAPRHPGRRDEITARLAQLPGDVRFRSMHDTPAHDTDIYVVDTMGELGLFFRLCPVAVIGRSFSRDGGGGHNPIEAALLKSYPLSGPNVQNLASIYDSLEQEQAVTIVKTPKDLEDAIEELLRSRAHMKERGAHAFQTVTTIQSQITMDVRAFLNTFLDQGEQA